MAAEKKRPTRGASQRFRIVAGRWRGRRFAFPPVAEVRPTPDRLRETLFNWLAPVIAGSRCLDLFAGSGALGLEALSRGAAKVTFVDREPALTAAIRAHLKTLDAPDNDVITTDGRAWLGGASQPFDIVFLDPPFASGWLPELCTLLAGGDWLSGSARVYVEYARTAAPQIPAPLLKLRSARAGAVEGALLGFARSD